MTAGDRTPPKVTPFSTLIRAIESSTAMLLGLCMGAVFLNVVLRFAFDSGITMTEELSRIALVWIVFFGAIAALHGRHHIGMTMAVEKMSHRMRAGSAVLTVLIMLVCDVLIVIGSWKQAMLAMNDSYPVSGLSSAVIYVPGIVAGTVFALITGSRLGLFLAGRLPAQALLCVDSEDAEAAPKDAES